MTETTKEKSVFGQVCEEYLYPVAFESTETLALFADTSITPVDQLFEWFKTGNTNNATLIDFAMKNPFFHWQDQGDRFIRWRMSDRDDCIEMIQCYIDDTLRGGDIPTLGSEHKNLAANQ